MTTAAQEANKYASEVIKGRNRTFDTAEIYCIKDFIAGYDCRMKETGDYPFEEQIYNLKATLELEEYNNTQLQAEIDELKQKLERKTKWISVDDELPKVSDIDLLIKGIDLRGKEGICDIGYMHGNNPSKENFISLSGEIVKVTNWRYID